METMHKLSLSLTTLLALLAPGLSSAADVPAAQAKIDAQIAIITAWAADPVIVEATHAHNAALPADEDALTQEKWHSLSTLDPLVRRFSKNNVGTFLSSKRSAVIGEAFVSDAAGCKVGFINKTTRWCHAGLPKHDVPMTGKTWQGAMQLDESSGMRLIQVSVPVLDQGKPIGSLVVGLSSAFLSE